MCCMRSASGPAVSRAPTTRSNQAIRRPIMCRPHAVIGLTLLAHTHGVLTHRTLGSPHSTGMRRARVVNTRMCACISRSLAALHAQACVTPRALVRQLHCVSGQASTPALSSLAVPVRAARRTRQPATCARARLGTVRVTRDASRWCPIMHVLPHLCLSLIHISEPTRPY